MYIVPQINTHITKQHKEEFDQYVTLDNDFLFEMDGRSALYPLFCESYTYVDCLIFQSPNFSFNALDGRLRCDIAKIELIIRSMRKMTSGLSASLFPSMQYGINLLDIIGRIHISNFAYFFTIR